MLLGLPYETSCDYKHTMQMLSLTIVKDYDVLLYPNIGAAWSAASKGTHICDQQMKMALIHRTPCCYCFSVEKLLTLIIDVEDICTVFFYD